MDTGFLLPIRALERSKLLTVRRLEFDARIEVVKVPIKTITGMLAAGEIEDAKAIIGLRALLAYLDQ